MSNGMQVVNDFKTSYAAGPTAEESPARVNFKFKGQALWFHLIDRVTHATCNVCHQTKPAAGRYASEKTPDIIVCSECAKPVLSFVEGGTQ